MLDGDLEVLGSYAGLRPLLQGTGKSADLSRHHAVLTAPNGVITVVGGKLTTYRRMAQDAVDAAVDARGLAAGRSRTVSVPLVGAAPRGTLAALVLLLLGVGGMVVGTMRIGQHDVAARSALAVGIGSFALVLIGGLGFVLYTSQNQGKTFTSVSSTIAGTAAPEQEMAQKAMARGDRGMAKGFAEKKAPMDGFGLEERFFAKDKGAPDNLKADIRPAELARMDDIAPKALAKAGMGGEMPRLLAPLPPKQPEVGGGNKMAKGGGAKGKKAGQDFDRIDMFPMLQQQWLAAPVDLVVIVDAVGIDVAALGR